MTVFNYLLYKFYLNIKLPSFQSAKTFIKQLSQMAAVGHLVNPFLLFFLFTWNHKGFVTAQSGVL